MVCMECGFLKTKVVDSRASSSPGGSTRRRRHCLKCKFKFTTYESVKMPTIMVIKNDDRKEIYDRNKIKAGILKASKNTSLNDLKLHDLILKIEKEIYRKELPEIKSKLIGRIVIKYLAESDKVAYLRFVSVYRGLKTIASLEKEMMALKKG